MDFSIGEFHSQALLSGQNHEPNRHSKVLDGHALRLEQGDPLRIRPPGTRAAKDFAQFHPLPLMQTPLFQRRQQVAGLAQRGGAAVDANDTGTAHGLLVYFPPNQCVGTGGSDDSGRDRQRAARPPVAPVRIMPRVSATITATGVPLAASNRWTRKQLSDVILAQVERHQSTVRSSRAAARHASQLPTATTSTAPMAPARCVASGIAAGAQSLIATSDTIMPPAT